MVDGLLGKLKLEQNGEKVWEGAIRLFPNCLSLSLRQLFTPAPSSSFLDGPPTQEVQQFPLALLDLIIILNLIIITTSTATTLRGGCTKLVDCGPVLLTPCNEVIIMLMFVIQNPALNII